LANALPSAGPLAGRGIVLTRPAHQAGTLAARVAAAGGRVILFPAIAILDPADFAPFNALVDRLHEFDLAIFISPNAVNKAMNRITVRRALPAGLAIAAVGHATANALRACGVANVIVPTDSFDSEALLALPALEAMTGKRVAIFRGEGGRELLGETLTARGARVEYAECYRRVKPCLDPAPLLDAWVRDELHAVVVTSSEGLNNLCEMIGKAGRSRLAGTPVFVPHARIAASANTRGLSKVVTTDAGDDGIVAGLCAYFSPAARDST
jgi:uroporphyrinogen-III synthase